MATILIVDDRPIDRQYLVTLLGYFEHRMLDAADGMEALALVRTEHPDLVITDILMPTMDGAELVHAIHADPALAAMPVIFYSASYREQEARAIAAQCGVSVVLSKPADPEIIVEVVNKALNSHAAPAGLPTAAKAPESDLGLLTDALAQRLAVVLQQSGGGRIHR